MNSILGSKYPLIMGTRFLASQESELHENLKKRMLDSASTDATLALGSIGDPLRLLETGLITKVKELEKDGAASEEVISLVLTE